MKRAAIHSIGKTIFILVILFDLPFKIYAQNDEVTIKTHYFPKKVDGGVIITKDSDVYKYKRPIKDDDISSIVHIWIKTNSRRISQTEITYFQNGDVHTDFTRYDCKDQKDYHSVTKVDKNNKTFYFLVEEFENRLMIKAYEEETKNGITNKKKYSIKNGIGTWENIALNDPYDNSIRYDELDMASCPPPSELFLGFSTIFEDSYERFNTYGINLSYIHSLSAMLGIMGDAGIYFGSQNQVNFTKALVMGGISLRPGNPDGNISFHPHLLAGVSIVNAKNGSSSSNASFTAAAGGDLCFDISTNKGINIRADYNPVFGSGNVAHNFRASAGLILKIK